jgi:hypothetical protein
MNRSDPTAEKLQRPWQVVAGPVIWAVHFLLCYITAAVWCEKFAGEDRLLGPVRTAIWIYTLVASVGILLTAWSGYKKHLYGRGLLPHDADSPEDRHRFLGFTTFLLSGLSLIGVLYEAMVLAFFWNCN